MNDTSNKVEPYPRSMIETFKIVYNNYQEYCRQLTDRVDYIVRKNAEIWGVELLWWDWGNRRNHSEDGEGEGYFEFDMIEGVELRLSGEINSAVYKIRENIFNFPTRWLYEDFEEEALSNFQTYKQKILEKVQREQKQAKKLKEEKIQKEILIQSIKQKLTPEEQKALNI